MIIDLDAQTLRVAASASFCFAAALFASVWRMYPRERALGWWSIANALCGVTHLFVLQYRWAEQPLALTALGAVYVAGCVLNWVGLRELFGAPRPWRACLALAAVSLVLSIVLPMLGERLPRVHAVRYQLWFLPGVLALAWAVDLVRLGGRPLSSVAWCLTVTAGLSGLLIVTSGLFGIFADMTGLFGAYKVPFFKVALFALVPGILAYSWGAMMMFNAKLRDKMDRLASIDGLTGLLNRRAFREKAEQVLQNAASCCLLVLDLDHFKSINDTYGHAGGDVVLRHFSALLASHSRRSDVTGRVGGEEFCVLLPGVGATAAVAFGERICKAARAEAVDCDGATVRMSTSIGIAVAEPGDTLDSLFRRADQALFTSKSRGRNCVTLAGA